jgi:hypothetical protein
MEVGTYHFTRGPKSLNPKYDMDVYMVALFGGEAQDVLRVGLSKIMDPTWHKIIKICIKHSGVLRLKHWDFASLLGFVHMSGT